ncbi:MAG: CS1-pili formation C-terminal domain-containing protein [Alphaproteobacteria bacterium]|nr:CS1-pili formation C-terminal domain-containing protein [Alphaproteobacteria bacterium]
MSNNIKQILNTKSKTLLILPPYDTYQISLLPKDDSSLEIDATKRPVTLYPGNIIDMDWDIHPITVILGRVVDTKGNPLANAKLMEARNITVSDEQGNFQGEIINNNTLTFELRQERASIEVDETNPALKFSSSHQRCQVKLSNVSTINGVAVYPDPLVCQ